MGLSTEERTILDNIMSLVQEIQQMETAEAGNPGGEGGEEAPPAQMTAAKDQAVDDNEVEPDEEEGAEAPEMKKARKSIDDQGEEASSARDDAEERIEDLPEETEDNVQEVAKMLAKILFVPKPATVRKSVTRPDRTTLTAIQALTQVVKSLAKRQKMNDSVMNDILAGLGIADQIEGTYKVNKSNGPVLNSDADKTIRAIKKVSKSIEDDPHASMMEVRKNFKGALSMLFGGK
jgi:hypothetical protein